MREREGPGAERWEGEGDRDRKTLTHRPLLRPVPPLPQCGRGLLRTCRRTEICDRPCATTTALAAGQAILLLLKPKTDSLFVLKTGWRYACDRRSDGGGLGPASGSGLAGVCCRFAVFS